MDIPKFKEGKVVEMDYRNSNTGIEKDELVIEVGESRVNLPIGKIKNFDKIWRGKPPARLVGKTISFADGIMRVIGDANKIK
jgi:hypothetical protein